MTNLPRIVRELKERIAELEATTKTQHNLMISGEKRGVAKATEEFKARITELEAQLKAVLDDNSKLAQVRQAHNLEQQAKGINDLLLTLVKSNGEPLKVDNLTNLIVHARYMANKLGEQAKALKEQEQANGMDAVWKLAKEQGV